MVVESALQPGSTPPDAETPEAPGAKGESPGKDQWIEDIEKQLKLTEDYKNTISGEGETKPKAAPA